MYDWSPINIFGKLITNLSTGMKSENLKSEGDSIVNSHANAKIIEFRMNHTSRLKNIQRRDHLRAVFKSY